MSAPALTWWEYFFGKTKNSPMRPTDAVHDKALRGYFIQMLDQVDPPDVFRPSEVAEQLTPADLERLGYETEREALPAIYELAFEYREFGYCVILRKGKILGDDVGIVDLDGPIRIRRTEG